MTELTERVLIAAASIINDIRAMQPDDMTYWFGGFSNWKMHNEEPDAMCIEWANLALSVDNLDQALKAIYSDRQDRMSAEIARIELEMVNAGRTEREK